MMHPRTRFYVAPLLAGLGATLAIGLAAQPAATGLRVEIQFAPAAHAGPVTGMVYLAISRENQSPPIAQSDTTGAPLFSTYVDRLQPGTNAAITAADRGHPLASLRDIPAGDYWLQPFVNVYTRFPRSDGHTIWLHNDQWEGQDWKRSPGNLLGDPVRVTFDPKSASPIRLVANKVIPPIQVPADTAMVKRI